MDILNNLIFGSSWMSTSESICKFQIKQENFFERISQVLQKKIKGQPKDKWWRMMDECYLSSKDSPERIKLKMQDERTNKGISHLLLRVSFMML